MYLYMYVGTYMNIYVLMQAVNVLHVILLHYYYRIFGVTLIIATAAITIVVIMTTTAVEMAVATK